jgi:formylglycine-generating enzyme required for sulfatase activity
MTALLTTALIVGNCWAEDGTVTATPKPLGISSVSPPSTTQGPLDGQPWENSLGMKFVPAGTPRVLFCIWDVRVKDFKAYAQATGYKQPGGINVMKMKIAANGSKSLAGELDPNASWEQPGFEQGPTHPVVGVSWSDAIAFCEWLTKKERGEGKLDSHQMYRLPTDAEWSTAVGNGRYPWGDAWPPPEGVGNYADQAFALSLPGIVWAVLPGNDGYPRTSPVGSFRANAYGLYDMGGNVWQWCMDWYQTSMNSDEIRKKLPALNEDGTTKVARGASWISGDPEVLLSSSRNAGALADRGDILGFRLILETSDAVTNETSPAEQSHSMQTGGAANTPQPTGATPILAPATTPQLSKISEAFGMKLGDVFDPTKALGQSKLEDGTPMYQFSPTQAFRSFTEYYVMITPQTNKIYCIWAQGPFDNPEMAKKEQALVMELLKEKYGDKQKQGLFDSIGDVMRIDDGNRYIITKVSGFSTATLDIRYYDTELQKLAEQERLKIEATKVNATGL